MALINLDRYLYIQKFAGGGGILALARKMAKIGGKPESAYTKELRSVYKKTPVPKQAALLKRLDAEVDRLIANGHRGELSPDGRKFLRNRNYENKKLGYPAVRENGANKGKTLKPGENPVDYVKKNEGTKSTTGTSDKKGNVENPLKKEAETAQKEAAEATKETKTTATKPAEKPKTNTETQNESTSNNSQNTSSNTTQNNAAIPQWKAGETEGVHGKEYIDGKKVKKFHKDKGLVSLEEFDKLEGKSSASPQQQGAISRLRNWLIGPAAPAGSEVAWNPQGILRRYADLRPYVEGRPFLYNPWVSSTALWTLAGGNEGHKRGYSYPDSYSVGFQSSPLMKILGIASGLTGVGDTFEEMERNGVIQKVNRNDNRQMVAAPQNYLDWDSLTDMDMAYNPYGGYMDNISPDFLED